jgi:chromosome segregation ATPase
MAALTAQVPPKKDALRERKTAHNLRAAQLAERAQECNEGMSPVLVQALSEQISDFPHVEYSHCLAQSSRITELEAKLVETKIKLARLRQQHPPSSRLTAARGEATAERQMTELIELNEHIDEGREQVEERSAKLKDTQKTAQQSATRKAELERELKAKKRALQEAGSAEDARVGELVEW